MSSTNGQSHKLRIDEHNGEERVWRGTEAEGTVRQTAKGFAWMSFIAKPPHDKGVAKTREAAFAQLGVRLHKSQKLPDGGAGS